jgi:tetratricopeptide (TPR) repeat protein
MAFNKSKALESALKFLNQGKVNQAIAEYQQILRNDPKDQATLMTVGDLFARQGDMQHALEYFERLAQVYLADGFNSKAIAIYKKIAKLAPQEIAPLERLADLYVQQGVLSEARPLFLQIAEGHLKANRAPKAVGVLRRLLEVEPENPRVQMRLAELYNVMGQKGDAAKTYLAYAQRLFDRGDAAESEKLVDRALEVLSSDPPALLLKAKIQASAGKDAAAIKMLSKHPEAEAGGEVTNLLVDLELKTGQLEAAADRARNQLVRGNSHFGLLYRVTERLVESGPIEESLPLFRELRDPMIEVGEHDKFVKLLSAATERLPGNTEALELLADFCRHTSDPFPLTGALTKLADIYEAAGNDARAEERLEELVDRNRDDERLAARLDGLRARLGKSTRVAAPPSPAPQPPPELVSAAPAEAEPHTSEPAAPAPAAAEALDPETEKYVAQALTDVDLFSSYGLTQKAVNLLESVLQRAPRHTPTLERLLDLSVGTGNDQRTAQLAATLEQIHRHRNDPANTDRFAELRRRYQSAAGLSDQEMNRVQQEPVSPGKVEPASVGAVPVDISVESAEESESDVPEFVIESINDEVLESVNDEAVESVHGEVLEQAARDAPPPELQDAASQEVDLSDEWEAMVQEVIEPPPVVLQAIPPAPVSAPMQNSAFDTQEAVQIELPPAPGVEGAPSSEPSIFEIREESGQAIEPLEFPDVPMAEILTASRFTIEAPEPASTEVSGETAAAETMAAENGTPEGILAEFELELTPEPSAATGKGPATTEEFISDLAAEVDGLEPPQAPPEEVSAPETMGTSPAAPRAEAPRPVHDLQPLRAPEPTPETLNQLAEVFQDFRNELGELGNDEDEDLETHYNLGIAYREMGLLEEAIGEFQKVAQAVQKGKPFRYAMNCASLLALSFRDKGEPKIASLWYQRALEVPGLEQETILALRYDLGISLEMAQESEAALDCFRQVYAMNIDYRDVADRIATLQHR